MAIWTMQQAIKAAELTLERLRSHHVRIPPENRLERARRIIQNASGETIATNLDDEIIAEALRTVLELHIILHAVNHADDLLRRKLGQLLEGHDIPKPMRTQSRDVQLELLLAATFSLAGIRGIALCEPDLRIPIGDQVLGIAAKRIASAKNMMKQCSKAIKQIRREPFPGIIAINLDLLVRGIGLNKAKETVTKQVQGVRALIRTKAAEEVVVGVIGFATIFEGPLNGDLTLNLHSHAELIAPEAEHEHVHSNVLALGQSIVESLAAVMSEP